MSDKQGLLLVISGPSGVGKGTVCKELIKLSNEYKISVSKTTRNPRPGETEGISYYFDTKENFEKLIDQGELLEYANFCGNYYGTPKKPVDENLKNGVNVILEIEVQGAMKVKEKRPDCLLIFVMPPSKKELKKRLKGRGTEPEDVIKQRLNRALEELSLCREYDYFVINHNPLEAAKEIIEIVNKERK